MFEAQELELMAQAEAARSLLKMTATLFALVVLFSFIGLHMGYDGLFLAGSIMLPIWLEECIKAALFGVQLFLVFSYSLNDYSKGAVKATLPFWAFAVILQLFCKGMLVSTVLPILYMMAISIKQKDNFATAARMLSVMALLLGYQLLMLPIKAGRESIGYHAIDTYQWLMMSIDLTILALLIYAIGGLHYYVELVLQLGDKRRGLARLFPESVNDAKLDNEDLQAVERWQALVGFRKLQAVATLLAFQLLQWLAVVGCCLLGNVGIEGALISLSFLCHGMVVHRRWHSNSVMACTVASAILFYIAARSCILFAYSQFFCIVVGMLLVYAMYRLAILVDNAEIKKTQSKLSRIETLKEKVETARKTIDMVNEMSEL